MNIAVVGAGGWGTALASILAKKHAVALYVRNPELAADLRRERQNVRYLPGVSLPDNLRVVDRLEPALEQAKIVVVATPSHGVRAAARALAPRLARGGWTLLNIVSIFGTEGLDQRKASAGQFFLRY